MATSLEHIREYHQRDDTATRKGISAKGQGALAYAAKHTPVFPVRAGEKRPHVNEWGEAATTDPRTIHAWWRKWPDADIGMPTGERSGLWVLDEDAAGAFENLESEHDPLPGTATARTPRDGQHKFFTHAPGITNSRGSLPEGIDVRGEGGFVVLPPVFEKGSSDGREWTSSHSPVEAPAWLLEMVQRPTEPQEGRESAESFSAVESRPTVPEAGERIPEGCRNQALFFKGLNYKDEGASADQVGVYLAEINATECDPPLSAEEVREIAKSVTRYPVRSGRPAPEVLEVVREYEAQWRSQEWPGVGGKTDRDIVRVLISLASRYGTLTENGALAVSASVRSIAIAAACHRNTVHNATKRLRDRGTLSIIEASEDGKAATWVLERARQGCDTHSSSLPSREKDAGVSQGSRAPHEAAPNVVTAPTLVDLETPCFRWSGFVKKGRAGVLYALESHCAMSDSELVEFMGWSRTRDLRKRYIEPLAELGLIETRDDGRRALPAAYAERIEEVRSRPYTVGETAPAASEIEREEADRERHERQREAFRLELVKREDVESVCFDELPPCSKSEPSDSAPRSRVQLGGLMFNVETGEVGEEIVTDPWEIVRIARERFGIQESVA